ncbi:MAG: hypothetical protein NTY77_00820, partial [Elusimicrobia bacterium]|nr:hypothetical protein [Elusimicrobiota bacterium]
MPPTTRNLTIFLTDIKGISAKTSRRARTGILELLASHHQSIVRPILQDKGGRMVKTIGDAFLMVFDSPTDAVLAGVAVQEALALHNQGLPEARRLQIRIAVNLGEVLLADNDVSGEPVDIVARLWAAAKPGEVYFTDAVYLAMNKSEVSIGEVDSFTFKGIPHTIRVYQARRRRSADGTQEQPQSLPRSTSDPAPVEDFVHLPPAEAPSPVPVYQPPEEALPSPQPASRPGPAEDLVAAAPAEPAPVEHAVAEEPPSSPPASRPSPTEDLVAAPPAEPVSVEHTVAEEPPQQYQA